MEINHPDARPLSTSEQALLEEFRGKLHQRLLAGGLNSADIQHLVAGLRRHPDASEAVVAAMAEEVRNLGQPLVNLRWDD